MSPEHSPNVFNTGHKYLTNIQNRINYLFIELYMGAIVVKTLASSTEGPGFEALGL